MPFVDAAQIRHGYPYGHGTDYPQFPVCICGLLIRECPSMMAWAAERRGDPVRRVLVTGSRNWHDPRAIRNALSAAWPVTVSASEMTVVHGCCQSGADVMADVIAGEWGWNVERHPADWKQFGKRAGFKRNAEMVALGADRCLAFIRNRSRGATHCADLSERAGIETIRVVV